MENENIVKQDQNEVNSHTESIETILQNIIKEQNVSTVQKLDLSKVNDDEWEQLGDAVMELQHPGSAHEIMDQMMGGEGSESLKQMHINMGKAYLGYGGNYGSKMMGGMTPLRQGYAGQVGFGSMMGYGYGNGFMGGSYGILGSITWLAVIVFLLAGTYFFIKQAHKGRKEGK